MNVATGLLLFAAAVLAANAPFLSRRILLVRPPAGFGGGADKNGWWRVLELPLLYFAVLGLARVLEAKAGEIYAQNWEFYAITVCLFVLLGFPGFVYRYLTLKKGGA